MMRATAIGPYRPAYVGSLGQLPKGTVTLLDPPVVEDGGITEVAPASKVSLIWSVDNTTTTTGGSVQPVLGFPDTFEFFVVPTTQVEQPWLTLTVSHGYAVLLKKPDYSALVKGTTFIATTSVAAIVALASSGGGHILVDGPKPLTEQAKGRGVAPLPGQLECPPGTTGTFPDCVAPLPGQLECPPGTTGTFPDCVVVDPEPKLPAPNGETPADTAKSQVPAWLLPTLVGVAGVSLLALLMGARRQKG